MDVIAYLILALPCDVPMPSVLRPVAVAMELADVGETHSTLTDLCVRWETIRNTPKTAELLRFPCEERDGYETARFFEERCRVNRAWHASRWMAWTHVVEEASHRAWAWGALVDARNPNYSIATRRLAMARLKTLIGPDAWARGEMPMPVVPILD